jgi:hypothetical protein
MPPTFLPPLCFLPFFYGLFVPMSFPCFHFTVHSRFPSNFHGLMLRDARPGGRFPLRRLSGGVSPPFSQIYASADFQHRGIALNACTFAPSREPQKNRSLQTIPRPPDRSAQFFYSVYVSGKDLHSLTVVPSSSVFYEPLEPFAPVAPINGGPHPDADSHPYGPFASPPPP